MLKTKVYFDAIVFKKYCEVLKINPSKPESLKRFLNIKNEVEKNHINSNSTKAKN